MGYAFADHDFVQHAEKFLNTSRIPLHEPCAVRGYDGASTQHITHFIPLTLRIANRTQRKIPFFILNLKSHDIILGKEWLSTSGVLLDCPNEKIIWKDTITTQSDWDRILTTSIDTLRNKEVFPKHQKDADRRDELLAIESRHWKPRKILTRQNNLQSAQLRVTGVTNSSVDICQIGATAYRLNVKKKDNLLFSTSLYEINSMLAHLRSPTPSTDRQPNEIEEAWLKRRLPQSYQEHWDVFSKEASNILPPHRKEDHRIELDGENTLTYHPLYRQKPDELEATKKYLTENLDKGFIEASQSPFAAPILFVKKANGSLRFCVDYRKLNKITKKDRYPLPLVTETLQRLSKAKIFTKLDIRQAFHRIRIDPASEDLTTFRTRYGTYKYKVMPFGLTNAPATYQRYMNDVLFDFLDDFCTAYVDDILIYSDNLEEHEKQVIKVLTRLREAGLQVDIDKSEFSVTTTKYLGFIISTDGIRVDPSKVQCIKDWKQPTTVKGIQAFLGFCNFYRRFIQEYGRVARPLTLLTRKDAVFDWTTACAQAFQKLKDALLSSPVLRYFTYGKEHKLETDASDGVIAAIMSERDEDSDLWHPVAFFSKTMAPAECNYPIHDKEMLAIVRAFEEWQSELISHDSKVPVYSDHRALEYFMTTKQLSARQVRWAEFLSQFHFEIAFRAGKQNEKADALTRREQDVKAQEAVMKESRYQTFLQPEQIHPSVQKDLELELSPLSVEPLSLTDQILSDNRQVTELEPKRILARTEKEDTWTLKDGLLFKYGKLIVPDTRYQGKPTRTALVKEVHAQTSMAHPGEFKTLQALKQRYYWDGMSTAVKRYIRNCHACKRSTVPRDKTPGLLQPLSIPERPWQHITMDFTEFPMSRNGYDMAVVFVCRLSKRTVTIPCHKTVTARDTATIFVKHVYRIWGPPDSIVSDRGPQFISDFWEEFTKELGIKLKLSTANHPQSDGQTEVVNQYIKQRLRPFVNYYQDNWDELLPILDFAQATLTHEATGQSPVMTEMGYEPRTSFDWKEPVKADSAKERLNREEAQVRVRLIHEAWQRAQEGVGRAQTRYAAQANKKRRLIDFDKGDMVYVKTKDWNMHRPSRKLSEQNAGPFEILEKRGNAFVLQLPDSIKVHPVFNAEKLRKAAMDPLEGQENEEPPPIEVDGEHEWEVEKILGVRIVRGRLRYRAQWVGFDEDLEEYGAGNFKHAPMLLKEFHEKYPDQPGPPRNLGYWLKCALSDELPEDRGDDDKP